MARRIKKLPTPDLSALVTPQLLGEVIKSRRTQSNLRLEDAAALCGVAKQTLMRIEHGNDTTQIGTALQICNALGIELFVKPWGETDEADDDWY
jgi:transcriptional regulator with XRE-family HTH domain